MDELSGIGMVSDDYFEEDNSFNYRTPIIRERGNSKSNNHFNLANSENVNSTE